MHSWGQAVASEWLSLGKTLYLYTARLYRRLVVVSKGGAFCPTFPSLSGVVSHSSFGLYKAVTLLFSPLSPGPINTTTKYINSN